MGQAKRRGDYAHRVATAVDKELLRQQAADREDDRRYMERCRTNPPRNIGVIAAVLSMAGMK